MSTLHYRPDIQGLRAIAVLAVILFHFNPAWLPGGFVGVDIFLVISGFLIVSILLQKKAQAGYHLIDTLQYFYISRFKRIVPAYFLMLMLVSLLVAVFFLPQDLETYEKGLKKAACFFSNSYFAGMGDYFAPATHEQPLLHTWSLAVEVQFYLLAPLLVLLVPTKGLKWLFSGILIGLSVIAEYRLRVLGIEQATYYSLYARLPEFFAGGLAALHMRSISVKSPPWLGALGLTLLLIAVVAQPHLGYFPGVSAMLPMAGTVMILLCSVQDLSKRLLVHSSMAWIGKLSYSLYLWHWPVLALLRYYTGAQVLDFFFGLLFIVATLSLATFSYYWVETPLRANRIRIKQALGYGVLTCAVFGTAPSMAKINKALSPPPLSIEYRRYADPATICHGKVVGDCLKGDLNSSKEVLVLGDSHAAMLNLFFDQLGKNLGFKARIITASSCVTIPGFDYQRIPEWSRQPCLEQIEQSKKYLPKTKIIFLAASWTWQSESEDFKKSLSRFLEEQVEEGKKIYILEQEPLLRKNPLRAIRLKILGLKPHIDVNPEYKKTNAMLRGLAEKYSNVISLNFESSNIFSTVPFLKDVPIYLDEHHLNEVGAKRYAEVASSTFKRIMD